MGDVLDELAGAAPLPPAATPCVLSAADAGSAMADAQLAAWAAQPDDCSALLREALRLARSGAGDPRTEVLRALAVRAFRVWATHAAPSWANTPAMRMVFLDGYLVELTR